MTCGFRTAAGADLDTLFLSSYQNAGAVGFRQADGVDLGNKYTHETVLGYSVGYKNAAGTDLGYLRGNAYAQPIFATTGVKNLIFQQYYVEEHDPGDDATSPSTYYTDKTTFVIGQVAPTLANYQASQSYTLIMDQLLWTTSGDSKGGACYGYFPTDSDMTQAMLNVLKRDAVSPEVRYEFLTPNDHDATHLTGNRHNTNNFEAENGRFRIQTPFVQGRTYGFRVWWGQIWKIYDTKWKCRYQIINNVNGKSTGWFVSQEYTCTGKKED